MSDVDDIVEVPRRLKVEQRPAEWGSIVGWESIPEEFAGARSGGVRARPAAHGLRHLAGARVKLYVLMEYNVEEGVLLGVYSSSDLACAASGELDTNRLAGHVGREIHEITLDAPAAYHEEDGEEL